MNYTIGDTNGSKIRRRLSTQRKSYRPPQLKPYNKQVMQTTAPQNLIPSPKNKLTLVKMDSHQSYLSCLDKCKARTPTEKINSFGLCQLQLPTTPPPSGQDKFFKASKLLHYRPEPEQKITDPFKTAFSKLVLEYFPGQKQPFSTGFLHSQESPTEKQKSHLVQQRTDRAAKASDYFSEEYCQPIPKDQSFLRVQKAFHIPEDLFKKANISPTHLHTCSTFESIRRSEDIHSGSPTRRPSRSLKIEDFVELKEMGAGSFGRVVMVMHRYTGFLSALKIIPKKMIIEKRLMSRLINELKIQSYLKHPNIVQLYGIFHDHDNIYILLELGSEGQLYTKLRRKERYSEYGALFIIRDLLVSVQYMHSRKILHRDIKPQNLVVVHGTVKLCDFGWAVLKGNNLRNTFCGTPLFLSPEQLSGKSYDQKVDLWAIGMLSYELVVGRIPFQITEKEELKKILTDQVTFPEELELSETYQNFVLKILAKDPKSRLQAEQLLKHPYISQSMSDDTNDQLCAN